MSSESFSGQGIAPKTYQPPSKDGDASRAHPDIESSLLSGRAQSGAGHLDAAMRRQLIMLVAVFGLLLLVAVLLSVFWQPQSVTSTEVAQNNTSLSAARDERSDEQAQSTPAEESSPFAEQMQAQQREAAQAVLADLMALQKQLTELNAEAWAAAALASVTARAEVGDLAYRQRDYPAAISEYEAALSTLQTIQAGIPEQVDAFVREGRAALAEGAVQRAEALFKQALALDRNSISALTGLARVTKWPEVAELRQQSNEAFANYQLSNDRASLEQAIALRERVFELDPLVPGIKQTLKDWQEVAQTHDFNAAMSGALNALFNRNYARAQRGFAAALNVRSNDSVARQGLQQALALDTNASLASLYSQARTHERAEDWQQATLVYNQILNRDAAQVSARTALIQAEVRFELDRDVDKLLSQPMMLTQPSGLQDAKRLLQTAQDLTRKGQLVEAQIRQLQTLISGLDEPVLVRLTSDQQTLVTLLKRGAKPIRYQPFSSKSLNLVPGSYELLGQRVGYQDVRQMIDIAPASATAQSVLEFELSCTQALNSSLSGR